MKFIVSGKNIEVTEALKERVIKKVGKLDKLFAHDSEAQITMTVQKNRQIVEVTIHFNGVVIRAEESSSDMYASIDKVVDILERQLRRYKTKLEKRLREDALKVHNFESQRDVEEEQDFTVVRSKKFAIKPMTIEEAILQMNLLGHEFFVFSNSESKEVNVVYKRKAGDYGLIEPQF